MPGELNNYSLLVLVLAFGMPGIPELLIVGAVILLVLGVLRMTSYVRLNRLCIGCFRFNPRDYRRCSHCGRSH